MARAVWPKRHNRLELEKMDNEKPTHKKQDGSRRGTPTWRVKLAEHRAIAAKNSPPIELRLERHGLIVSACAKPGRPPRARVPHRRWQNSYLNTAPKLNFRRLERSARSDSRARARPVLTTDDPSRARRARALVPLARQSTLRGERQRHERCPAAARTTASQCGEVLGGLLPGAGVGRIERERLIMGFLRARLDASASTGSMSVEL